MSRDYRVYLDDIRRAAEKVLRYTAGLDYTGRLADGRNFDAVVRNPEMIGEAARHLPGRLTADQGGIELVPWPAPPPDGILFAAAPLHREGERVRFVHLLPECSPPADKDVLDERGLCGDYRFSPDGRWVAFLWGGYGCNRLCSSAIPRSLLWTPISLSPTLPSS